MDENKFGKCVTCKNFIVSNEDYKLCACKVKPGYVTMNAEKRLYCDDFEERIIKIKAKRKCQCGFVTEFEISTENAEIFKKEQAEFDKKICENCGLHFIRHGEPILV